MHAAPDPLTVELSMFADPDPIVWAMVSWNGDPNEGLSVLKPLRAFATPIADTIDVVPWARFLARMPERTRTLTPNTYWRGGTLSELSDGAIDQFEASIEAAPPGWQLGLGHFMHGRICKSPAGETPLRRAAGQSTHFVSSSWREPGEVGAAMQWVDSTWGALHQFRNSGTYINYLSETSDAAVRTSYGEHYTRLATIKRRYDPDNVFHRNRNIRPLGAEK
jgi:hypothetical protein